MRDQWRVEDKHRDDTHYCGRGKGSHRRESPPASKGQSDTDIGVKIRGRAAAGATTRPSPREGRPSRQEGLRQGPLKDSDRSPQRRSKGERSLRRPTELSAERHIDQYPGRQQYRDSSRVPLKRRKSRSRPPHQASFTRKENRRSRGPVIFDGADRAPRVRSRHRESLYSPRASPRGDYYSGTYDDLATTRSTRDSYVPSSRRSRSPAPRHLPRSRSPAPRLVRPSRLTYRRSQSPRRRTRPRENPATGHKENSGRGTRSVRERDLLPSSTNTKSRSRNSSRSEHHEAGYRRRRSRPRSLVDSSRAQQKRGHSKTPPTSDSARGKIIMQPSTRPIQSILDDGSHPPSPPRPIPSFDSDSHNPNAVREAYPMHGMKAHIMHGDSRPGRTQIDTRQSYNTSPQWTPTSSHHGSPQSGSPFSHGRGGWSGPQQFHGQPGYVFLPSSLIIG